MINKYPIIVSEWCGSGIVSGWAQKRLWQCLEECYCQQCAFPAGKHIAWPNAAKISNIQHLLVLLISMKTLHIKKERKRVCGVMTCDPFSPAVYFIHNAPLQSVFHSTYRLDLQSWMSVWQSHGIHGRINPIRPITLSTQNDYWWLWVICFLMENISHDDTINRATMCFISIIKMERLVNRRKSLASTKWKDK